jgi:Fe2+ or Zn2+ uptake regulation protein
MPVIKSYYQTTPMTEEEFQDAVKSCRNQETKVYQIFKKYRTMTAWDVYDIYNELIGPIHITSIRRALDTLQKNEVLEQIGTLPGDEGRPVFLLNLVDGNKEVIERKLNTSIPKHVKLNLVFTSDGKIDREKIYEQLQQNIQTIKETFNLN